ARRGKFKEITIDQLAVPHPQGIHPEYLLVPAQEEGRSAEAEQVATQVDAAAEQDVPPRPDLLVEFGVAHANAGYCYRARQAMCASSALGSATLPGCRAASRSSLIVGIVPPTRIGGPGCTGAGSLTLPLDLQIVRIEMLEDSGPRARTGDVAHPLPNRVAPLIMNDASSGLTFSIERIDLGYDGLDQIRLWQFDIFAGGCHWKLLLFPDSSHILREPILTLSAARAIRPWARAGPPHCEPLHSSFAVDPRHGWQPPKRYSPRSLPPIPQQNGSCGSRYSVASAVTYALPVMIGAISPLDLSNHR